MSLAVALDARGVARVTLDRPERHNALDAGLMDDLTAAATRLAADPAVRVVVLAAVGESFCAGADLDWMRAQMEAGPAGRDAEARRLAGMLRALDTLPAALVAEVRGPAYGGGVGLLAVCDIAVAAEGATLSLTETRLGLIPATIGPYVLPRIGAAAWRRNVLPARRIPAAEALAMGLLSRVVSPADLGAAVEEEVAALLACAPGAIADAKAQARSFAASDENIEAGIAALAARWETEEARTRIRAFLDRRSGRDPSPTA